MKVNEDGHYFFLLEEAEKNNASLLAKVSEYKTLFQTLAEENTLAVLLFLYQRKDIGFTCELLADKLGHPIEQVKKSRREFPVKKYEVLLDRSIKLEAIPKKVEEFFLKQGKRCEYIESFLLPQYLIDGNPYEFSICSFGKYTRVVLRQR